MIYLFISVICSALIGNLLFIFQKDKKSEIMLIFLGNYFIASIFSLASNDTSWQDVRLFEVLLGCVGGFLFLYNFVLYQKNIIKNGLSLSVGVMRISVLIPILLSVFIFGEKVLMFNYLGIGVVMLSFIFMSETRNFHSFLWILLLFLVTGTAETVIKLYDVYGLPQQGLFVFFIFFSALIMNLIFIMYKKIPFQWRSFGYGLILGIPNQLTTRLFLTSLSSVKAPIAYPLYAASVVIITIVADLLIWRKRFSVKQRIALALLIIGIVLLNLR